MSKAALENFGDLEAAIYLVECAIRSHKIDGGDEIILDPFVSTGVFALMGMIAREVEQQNERYQNHMLMLKDEEEAVRLVRMDIAHHIERHTALEKYGLI